MPPDPAVTSDYNERGGVPAPAIDDYASVRLLAQRARAVLPGFEVTLASWPRLVVVPMAGSRRSHTGGGQSTQRVLIVTPPRARPPARAAARTQTCDHMFSWISLASRSLL
jgi:hypothetical protein